MFLPLAAAAALAIGALSPRSLATRADGAVLGALTGLLVIALATIARQPTMLRAAVPAASIIDAHPDEIAINEIGSTSCKARVCQYAKISVVAISLKQQHVHRKTHKRQ